MEEFKTELKKDSLTMTNFRNVPGKMESFDEEPSVAESPTTPHAGCTPVSLAARKAAAISGRKKKKKTASSTSLASNTFQVWKKYDPFLRHFLLNFCRKFTD